MDYAIGRTEFIESWGQLAISWGENRTIGLVHGLLLISCTPLCADDIMKELSISRGSVNNTIHRLIDLQLIHKQDRKGERKDYFVAEKNMWNVMKSVAKERKRKELEPMIATLDKLEAVQPKCNQSEEFLKTIGEIKDFSLRADRILDTFTGSEMNWLLKSMTKVIRK